MNVAATGQPHYQQIFEPIPTGFTHVDFDDIEALKTATTDETCAVMLEPVQGEGGVNIPSVGYLEQVREWCDENGLLLIFDEVQTGLGRLGTLFGYQSFDVEPDIMTLAKGLGGGVPIGAVPRQGPRYGVRAGRPRLHVRRQRAHLRRGLCFHQVHHRQRRFGATPPRWASTWARRSTGSRPSTAPSARWRGMGMLWAVLFDSDISPAVVGACNEAGILLNPLRPNAVRLMPPLTVTREEIDEAMERLDAGLVPRPTRG